MFRRESSQGQLEYESSWSMMKNIFDVLFSKKIRHIIINEKIIKALQPIRISSTLFISSLDAYPTVPTFGFELFNYLALEIVGYLGDVKNLENLEVTSAAFWAVVRGRNLRDSLLKPLLVSSISLFWAKDYCPHNIARTFANILNRHRMEIGRECLGNHVKLGCGHGGYLAMDYISRRQNYFVCLFELLPK